MGDLEWMEQLYWCPSFYIFHKGNTLCITIICIIIIAINFLPNSYYFNVLIFFGYDFSLFYNENMKWKNYKCIIIVIIIN